MSTPPVRQNNHHGTSHPLGTTTVAGSPTKEEIVDSNSFIIGLNARELPISDPPDRNSCSVENREVKLHISEGKLYMTLCTASVIVHQP